MKIFEKLFRTLNQKRIKYLVAGGVAVNLYGIERATADIDIVLKLDKKNLLKFVDAAKRLGLRPKDPVRLEDFTEEEKRKHWLDTKGMKVFSLYDPQVPFFCLMLFLKYLLILTRFTGEGRK